MPTFRLKKYPLPFSTDRRGWCIPPGECLSRACWQIIAGRGDGWWQQRFSCSHYALLTSETGGALGYTAKCAIRGALALRRPWLRPAAPPVSEASGAKMETKESLMPPAIPSDFGAFANKPISGSPSGTHQPLLC